ncbi:Loganic acid O-methyltransferase [Sesamum angolense]|uniref:Loganic acid O-methyltransferase n=1 Tax=Sesamum angolense TaxID=2727404 RepID=A0AAE2C5X1_9LAMI|nr:Loganic acid O-methyltransferase [Sesamum angolense]
MQRGVVDVAKPIIEEAIKLKLDISQLCSNGLMNSFWIARSLQQKFQSERLVSQIPDFYVLFNDQVTNDFNTLFRSLPPERHYQAVGLPGSYHGRLLPKASLHFAYSSWALHWLSQVPTAVADPTSPAWNKGRVHYLGARQEVVDAYSSQHAKDIETFLEARAQELVSGGLMVLVLSGVIPTSAENSNTSYTDIPTEMALIGSCLTDMAKKGGVSEAKIDSFNFPIYFSFPEELKAIIVRNGSYNIERMEMLENPGKHTLSCANARASFHRATLEGLLIDHFGCEITDELFDRYAHKLQVASPAVLHPDNDKSILIFVLLKHT